MEKNNNFNGDAKFFEEQEAKHKAFFENISSSQADVNFFENLDRKFKAQEKNLQNPEPDEDFFKRQEDKHKAFFEETKDNHSTTDPKTSTSTSNMSIHQDNNQTVSTIVTSLKKKGISVSPEEISKMIAQHSHQNYTLQQIADVVEVDCELMHAKKQKKQQNGMTM